MHSLNILNEAQINKVQDVSQKSTLHRPNSITKAMDGLFKYNSQGTKVGKMKTLAPERYTAGFGMAAKVIIWCIWNHCIADLIDLHNISAVSFSTEAQQEHVKISFFKISYILIEKNRDLKILCLYNKTTSTYTPEAMVVI